ncbi:hypothetical protein HYQ46_007985 [Verticillium longisporum]|nr:hypothetical protein HYQ46_007985 [Verticillium longisporum]
MRVTAQRTPEAIWLWQCQGEAVHACEARALAYFLGLAFGSGDVETWRRSPVLHQAAEGGLGRSQPHWYGFILLLSEAFQRKLLPPSVISSPEKVSRR